MAERNALVLRAGALFGTLMTRSVQRASAETAMGAIRIGLASAGPAVAVSTAQSNRDTFQGPATSDLKTIEDSKTTVLRTIGEQMSFGGVLGFATGFSIRKVGRAVLFLIGTEVVILQYMAYREWLSIDWRRLSRDLSPKLDKSTWNGLIDILVYKMPFSAAFSTGLVAGLRLSAPK